MTPNIQSQIEALIAKLQDLEGDVEKHDVKKQKAAGPRLRKALQDTKKSIDLIRKQILEDQKSW